MTVFEYSAFNESGKKTSGIIDAESVFSARSRLRQKQIFPVSIKEIGTEASRQKKSDKAKAFIPFFRISPSEIAVTTRQLATLLSAGFPLVTALASLIPQTDSKALKRVLSKVKAYIEEGKSLSFAFAQYPSVFSKVYVNMITAGESSGTLDLVLERLADITEKQEDTRKKIRASLAYPLLMGITGSAVLVFLITYIVPGIVDIFTEMNQALPTPTILLISLSRFFQSFWWIAIVMPAAIFFTIHLVRKTETGLYTTDRWILGIPLAGDFIKKGGASRFARILGALLGNGVPMLTALEIARNTTGNSVIQKKIALAAEIVKEGGELGDTLEGSSEFPALAVQMIKIGEKSGELEKMLEKTAELFEKETQSTLTAITSLLEPAIILIMGAVVGFIVLSICLPIFEMNQLAR
ncbi:GspF1 [Desulfamplus magnetovallimortis]|uniref:General secretion pathway protein F n=1 Tax=Desulfamplus magnetovallimortis TaxID=1246637 RepID=A0A1W1HKU3_9BACT|nr:type II secretion system inner membrane protein GspF [Desulfamplus magnetovallimortis]SLM32968.1 GspF1 [Desulfamplus magnetovallimortis]